MVLVRHAIAASALLLFTLVGCLKSQPVQRLSKPQTIVVAVVHDSGSGLGKVPLALTSEVKGALELRNLVMTSVGPQQYQGDFSRKLASKARMKTLQKDLAEERTEVKSLKQFDPAKMKKNLDATKKKLTEKTTATDLLQKSLNKSRSENVELESKVKELEAKVAELEVTETEEEVLEEAAA